LNTWDKTSHFLLPPPACGFWHTNTCLVTSYNWAQYLPHAD